MKKAIFILPLLLAFICHAQTSKKLSAPKTLVDAIKILAVQYEEQFVQVTSGKEITYSTKIDDDDGQFSDIYEGVFQVPGSIENAVVSDFALSPSRSYVALFLETGGFEIAKNKYVGLCKQIRDVSINDKKLIGEIDDIDEEQPNTATRFDLVGQTAEKDLSVTVILLKNRKDIYKVFIGIGNGFSLENWVNSF